MIKMNYVPNFPQFTLLFSKLSYQAGSIKLDSGALLRLKVLA